MRNGGEHEQKPKWPACSSSNHHHPRSRSRSRLRSLRDFHPPPPPPTTSHHHHETTRALRNDLSATLKQNRVLQASVKKLKEQLKEAREKDERSREITGELKRYSNKLRDELEEVRGRILRSLLAVFTRTNSSPPTLSHTLVRPRRAAEGGPH